MTLIGQVLENITYVALDLGSGIPGDPQILWLVSPELLGLQTPELEAPQEHLTRHPYFLTSKTEFGEEKNPYFCSLFCILCSHAYLILS